MYARQGGIPTVSVSSQSRIFIADLKPEVDMITQARLKELFDYDPESGNLIWRVDRGANKMRGKVAGYIHSTGYRHVRTGEGQEKAHRLIWMYHYGSFPTQHVDHINGDCSDNRIENLREATRSQNQQNRRVNKNSSTGLLGVQRNHKKWKATIRLNNAPIYIGTFDTPEEAHQAYLAKKRELHPFSTIT
jgi:HNH endonuclease